MRVSGPRGEYDAIFHVVSLDGRSVLEVTHAHHTRTIAIARAFFQAAKDLPILGYVDWLKISNHYVVISRHTARATHMAIKRALIPHGARSWMGYAA